MNLFICSRFLPRLPCAKKIKKKLKKNKNTVCKIVFYQQRLTGPGAPPPPQTYAFFSINLLGAKDKQTGEIHEMCWRQYSFGSKPAASVWNAYRWGSGFHSGVDLYCALLPLQRTVAATTARRVQEHCGKYTNPFTGSGESPCAFDIHPQKKCFAILEFFFQCAVHHRVCLVWKLTRWVSEWPCWLFLCPSLQALDCYRNLITFCWWVWLAQWHCWLTCMRLRTTATQSLKYSKSRQSWM